MRDIVFIAVVIAFFAPGGPVRPRVRGDRGPVDDQLWTAQVEAPVDE